MANSLILFLRFLFFVSVFPGNKSADDIFHRRKYMISCALDLLQFFSQKYPRLQ